MKSTFNEYQSKNIFTLMSKKIVYILIVFSGFANAQIVTIPDANFKAKLIQLGVDSNSDGNIQTAEALLVTNELNVNGSTITDLTGFEAFTNVPVLRCTNNNLSALTISNMPNLRTIDCGFNSNLDNLNLTNLALDTLKVYNNNLSTINVNNLTTLKHLDCSYNYITNLNISNLTNLKILNCNRNQISSLSLATLVNLEELEFAINQIGTIDVSPLVNLKKLVCYNNGMPALNVSNLSNLEYLDNKNNNCTSLTINGLPNLKYLTCSGNNLTSLNASILPSLISLDCSVNNLNSINVNGLTNLQFLSLASNQVTSINVSGLTSLNNFNCSSNQLTALNVTGLTSLVSLYTSNNLLTSLILNNLPIINLLYCDYNQLSSLDLTGLSNLQILYCNNNLLTSLILNGAVSLDWIDCHENLLTTVNFTGLTSLQTVLCDTNQLTDLDFSTCPLLSSLSCSFNNLVTMNIKNGYQYINPNNFWHENPNLTFICADDGDLPFLNQILTQSFNVNAANVVYNTYCSFTPGGNYNTISGTMLFDANNNGCDVTDLPQSFIKAKIDDGISQGTSFTNTNGNYGFFTQAGGFTITPTVEDPTWFTFSPANAVVNFADNNNNISTNDFCISANGIHPDVEMVIVPIMPARPGFDAVYKLVYKNKGNQTVDVFLNFYYNEAVLDYVSESANSSNSGDGFRAWSFNNLLPFQSGSIEITLNVNGPTETPAVNIGDVLTFTSFIDVSTDENWVDNAFEYNQIVVGSYDPNNIECLQGDIVAPTEIGKYLHYVINFENTGNFQAENIVVKTTVDALKFDVNTIQIMNTSDNAYIKQTGNVVEFIFENINLASGGHGNVLLKVKTKNTLVQGDMVSKRADIFFDYNFPIDTGFANTTFQALSNPSFETDNSISVSPNPTASIVNINGNFNIKSVELYDVQGRLLQTIVNDGASVVLDISSHQSGIYFIKATSDKGIKVEKIVKE